MNFYTIIDIFAEDILDFLYVVDLANLEKVTPCVVRMYKCTYLDQCISYDKSMYIECSYCGNIDEGKSKKGIYICRPCVSKIIDISIF